MCWDVDGCQSDGGIFDPKMDPLRCPRGTGRLEHSPIKVSGFHCAWWNAAHLMGCLFNPINPEAQHKCTGATPFIKENRSRSHCSKSKNCLTDVSVTVGVSGGEMLFWTSEAEQPCGIQPFIRPCLTLVFVLKRRKSANGVSGRFAVIKTPRLVQRATCSLRLTASRLVSR